MTELIYPVEPAPVLRGCKVAKAAEMLPVVDVNGYVVAQASRSYCHSGVKPLHPVVHLHIINRNSEIYLQKRSATKELLPLYWDTAVGGHISYGEHVIEALYREASEELGLFDFNPFPICSYLFESDIEKELVNVFAAVGSPALHPDGAEVEEGRWWPVEEIESSMGKNILTPNFEGEFARIKNSLVALL